MAFSFYTLAPNGAVADDIEHVLDTVDLGKRRNIEHLLYVNGSVGVIVHYKNSSPTGVQLAKDLQHASEDTHVVQLHVSGLDLDMYSYPVPKDKKTRK